MTGQEVSTIIDQLSQKLEVSAQQLISIYVPMAKAEAVIDVMIGCFVVVTAFAIRGAIISFGVENKEAKTANFFGLGILLVLILFSAMFFFEGVPRLFAPEAAAINEIIDALKK